MYLRRIFLILCLLLHQTAGAREYTFRHLTTENGLLSDFRLSMAEDRHGRLWISGDEGINVYDGHEMSAYSAPAAGLLTNHIDEIFCDKAGTIWIASPAGVQYRRESDAAFRKLAGVDSEFSNAQFFADAPGGGILITTSYNCFYINPQFRALKLDGLSSLFAANRSPNAFYHFGGDYYLLGFRKKLVMVNVRSQQTVKEYGYRDAWCMARMSDSTIMAGSFTKDSIVIINLRTGGIECINDWPASDGERIAGYAGTIQYIGDNKYAVGCRLYGVYIIDVAARAAQHLLNDPGDARSIATRYCRKLFVSSKGIMWVHTRGLSYTGIGAPQFGYTGRVKNAQGDVYDGGFNAFAEDAAGELWAGTNSFVLHYDRRTGLADYHPFYDPKGGPQKFKTIRSVMADAAGRIWAGSFGTGLGLLQKDKTWKCFLPDTADRDHSMPSREVLSMSKKSDGSFIICTNAGFAQLDPQTEAITAFGKHPVLKTIARKVTFYAFEDRRARLWLAQSGGLYCYDSARAILTKIELPKAWVSPLMMAIGEDAAGTVYAGGYEGLILIDPATFVVKRILGKKDGLVGNGIVSIHTDRHNNVWILGNRGMAKYEPATGVLQSFGAKDGVEQTNHAIGNLYESKSGEMYAGSFAGFNYFDPERIEPKKEPLDVFVTAAELPDTLITTPLAGTLRLEAYNNNITFSYLAADFNPGAAIRYRYKLAGFDTGFVDAGLQRKAKYTNLPAGHYTFIVEASSNGSDWYRAADRIDFSIARIFYKTWWFLLLTALLLLGATYAIFRRRVALVRRAARRESEHEIKMNELENSSLRTQMNPHFIFNSLNTINAFINSNEKGQANQYISKFSKLIRLILDHSRQRTVPLAEELEALKVYVEMEQIRFDKKFSFSTAIDEDVAIYDTEIPSLIFQPFVENAILHGLLPMVAPGHLSLHISRKSETLFCVIEDNGIGRVKAVEERKHRMQNKKSHGLEITLKRMELYNKEAGLSGGAKVIDLYDDAGLAAGTRVEITLALTERF